jgi:predicted metalloenzyme YecM
MVKDHIAYRTSTLQIYEKQKQEYEKLWHILLQESIVNGRPISIRRLEEPESWFPYKELQAPRDDEPLFDGLEHRAYVVEDLNNHYARHHADHTIDIGEIKEYGDTRYYKIQTQDWEEIEYRERSISEN